jgi:hypothetical protein
VELAWTLAALCEDEEAALDALRSQIAARLVAAFNESSGMFPHVIAKVGSNPRWHVSWFPDLIHAIHALSVYSALTHEPSARMAALRCAERLCELQGPAGQWWWQYDWRTGQIVEKYPVYAIHQDALAPMALRALQDAAGLDCERAILRGLHWLAAPPELKGASLIDETAGLIWRKVGRREPRKLCRYTQAIAARIHSRLRVPGLDTLFPPVAVCYEDCPHHPGWLLHAWRTEGASVRPL